MADKDPKSTMPDLTAEYRIITESIEKEEKHIKLVENYGINPFRKRKLPAVCLVGNASAETFNHFSNIPILYFQMIAHSLPYVFPLIHLNTDMYTMRLANHRPTFFYILETF